MELIEDIGEHIPYAKKDMSVKRRDSTSVHLPVIDHVTLKSIWPEPDWKEMYLDGVDKTVLSIIYSIYHSLTKSPHKTEQYRFNDKLITLEMWQNAYCETVKFIREGCENAVSVECCENLKKSFSERFNVNGKKSYFTYAAGKKTKRTFFHPLGENGPAGEYRNLLPYLDFPLGINPKKIPLFPTKLIHNATQEEKYLLCKLNKKSISWNDNHDGYHNEFNTYEEAVQALIEYHGSEFTVKAEKKKEIPKYTPKKPLSDINGVSPNLSDISADSLMHRFKFRGIQFGNYLPQNERQTYINNLFHSLNLLSDLLNVPPSWLGGGELGIAIGARGHGFAAAHYEVELHVINLTRFNGPGSIAHEIFHSLDARMAKKWISYECLLSEAIEQAIDLSSLINPQYQKRYMAFEEIVRACTTSHSFVQNSLNIQSQNRAAKYWHKPSELCARAFEAYIQDCLESLEVKEQWLAFGTKETDYITNDMHPYPCGRERILLNECFKKNLRILFHGE